eukprot:2494412-Amphidinium_carterae.1
MHASCRHRVSAHNFLHFYKLMPSKALRIPLSTVWRIMEMYFDGNQKAPTVAHIATFLGASRSTTSCVSNVVTGLRRAESLAYQQWSNSEVMQGYVEADATCIRAWIYRGRRHCLQVWGACERGSDKTFLRMLPKAIVAKSAVPPVESGARH